MENKIKNIKDLAALLNISATTVSRVLNGKAGTYRISPATSQKVLDAAEKFNYHPNRIARGLRLERTETLGLIVPDIANPFFASIAKTIEFEARRNGYSLILCDSLDNEGTEKELLQLLAGRKVDGIILAPVGKNSGHITAFTEKGIPLIIIDRYLPGTGLPFVTTDNYTGAFEAVEHMILQGHKRIACIQGVRGTSVNTDRVTGYKDALKKQGISVDRSLIPGNDFGEENGYINTRKLLNKQDPPTAILALSNLISLGVMRALSENNLKIPDDVSLVAFDDQPYSGFLSSPMTMVDQHKEEIGKLAVNYLVTSIYNQGKQEHIEVMLKPRLIIRKSVNNITVTGRQ